MGLAFTKLFARLFSKKEMAHPHGARALPARPAAEQPADLLTGAPGLVTALCLLTRTRVCRWVSTQLVRRRSCISSSWGERPCEFTLPSQRPTGCWAGLSCSLLPAQLPGCLAGGSWFRSQATSQLRFEQPGSFLDLAGVLQALQSVAQLLTSAAVLQRDCDDHPNREPPCPACRHTVAQASDHCLTRVCCRRSASTWRQWSTRTSPSRCGMWEDRTRRAAPPAALFTCTLLPAGTRAACRQAPGCSQAQPERD